MDRCHRRQDEAVEQLVSAAFSLNATPPGEQAMARLQRSIEYFLRSTPRHFADEEQTVFPRLVLQMAHLKGTLATIVEQHAEQLALHQQLAALAASHRQQASAASATELLTTSLALESIHRDHAAAEDRMFEAAANVFSQQQDEDMLAEMESRRHRAPHP